MSRPLKTFRAEQVSCALWENELTEEGDRVVGMLKATFERRHKSGGNRKSRSSFGRNEIPLVKWCRARALPAMIEEQSVQNGKVEDEVVE